MPFGEYLCPLRSAGGTEALEILREVAAAVMRAAFAHDDPHRIDRVCCGAHHFGLPRIKHGHRAANQIRT
jgi:hypothetical protein